MAGEDRLERIEELLSEVKELTRTLRGSNGTPGLITEFHLLKRDMQDALMRIEQTQRRIEDINQNGCNFKLTEGEIATQNLEERAPTFKWYREKLFIPVVVAVIITLINGLILADIISKLK